jgi:hypothetical protein
MNDENERSVASAGSVTAGIRKCIAAYEQIPWGWDGDCGANDIISRIAEECDKIDAARPAPTLTDAEREAVDRQAKWLVNQAKHKPDIHSADLLLQEAATLRGLLERMK